MRTQAEILNMIRQIHRSKTDPSQVQIKTLIRKLEWNNAKQFAKELIPAQFEDQRIKHESANNLDPQELEREMAQRIEQLFEFVADAEEYRTPKDMMKVHIHLQMILVYLWLMGKRREELFRWLFKRMGWENMNQRQIARHIADEFEVNWKLMELRYP